MGDIRAGPTESRSTNDSYRVSVALATYNGERYVAEQLQSILGQTRMPDEIVVVDDGSIDRTVHVVDTALAGFPGTLTFERRAANAGLVATFERALEATTGDIVFLSDQDDVWHSDKIETVIGEFERRRTCALVIHDIDFCDADLRPLGQSKLERFKALGEDARTYVTGMATAVSRDLLDTALPFPADLPGNHDDWLHLVADFFGARCILPTSLALYRRHATNATGSSSLNHPQFVQPRRPLGRVLATVSDSVASCPRHRSRVALRLDQVATTLDWAKRQARLRPDAWTTLHSGDDSDRALVRLEQLERLLRQRLHTLDQRPWTRVVLAVKAFVRGEYAEFSGFWSMAQDIVCPAWKRE